MFRRLHLKGGHSHTLVYSGPAEHMATTSAGLLTAMGVPGPKLGWVFYEAG